MSLGGSRASVTSPLHSTHATATSPARGSTKSSKRWHEPLGAGRLRSGPPPLDARDSQCGTSELQRRPLMAILAGFDVHRAQITFDGGCPVNCVGGADG